MALDTIIELNNVSVFQQKVLILTNVNLSISKGEFAYLIGKTGSGKSSLLKVLYADLPLLDGSGRIAGFELHDMKRKDIPFLRRKLGIVFQDFQLLTDRTVNENLLFVLRATGWKDRQQMQERLQDVLDKVGLGTKGFKMPNELSGGEQQRVAIARALCAQPDILLADEPTGNLDSKSGGEIIELLENLNQQGVTLIIITHDQHIGDRARRKIRIVDGQIRP